MKTVPANHKPGIQHSNRDEAIDTFRRPSMFVRHTLRDDEEVHIDEVIAMRKESSQSKPGNFVSLCYENDKGHAREGGMYAKKISSS